MDHLVFLDTETTGLDMEHDIWEIAYAIGDEPVGVFQVPHSLKNADPEALFLNGYHQRFDPSKVSSFSDVALKNVFKGKTIVGANPAFDAYRLARRWGVAPWRYRMIDVESMAIPVFNLPTPIGLKDIAKGLTDLGYDIPEPDHTAARDVETVRAVYKALRAEGRKIP